MPHLVILYTPNVEADADVPALCRAMADFQRHVHEGVVVLGVGHAQSVQAQTPAADAAEGEHTAVAEGGVDFFE